MQDNGRVTIRDIAKIARVSPATVSLVLNNKGNINRKTRQHIKKIAEDFQYKPSPMARWLRGSKTHSIGVVIDHFHNQHFTNVFKGIEAVIDEAGYTFFVSESQEILAKEKKQLENMAEMGVDGIIVIPCSKQSAHLKTIQNQYKIPIILIGNYFEENPFFFSVVVDNLNGSRLAGEHLISLSRTPIIHIAGSKHQTKLLMRRRGFENAIREKTGKEPDPGNFYTVGSLTPQEGYQAMTNILKDHKTPLSVYVVNDNTALGVMTCCREKSLKIPKDVAVIGFSDIDMAGLMDVSLSTIHIPAVMMGKKAASLLLECIENPQKYDQPERIVLPVSLIRRDSTRL